MACVVLAFGCGSRRHDSRLEHVADIVSESPREALSVLDSIDCNSLSKADRHYYDFLNIKAKDKAYILHKSDSLILEVINYASSHKEEGWYAEALYYGGRVYSDLGDYPTALRYFRDAMDNTGSADLEFRGAIYSQIGATLHGLRLYSEAIPYIHKSIQVSDMLNDTLNLVYDYSTLCQLYLNNQELDSAKKYNVKALRLSKTLSPREVSNMEIDKAAILYKEGHLDSALSVIRPLPLLVDSICLNLTYALASNDTLLEYIPRYKEMIEQYLNNHESQQTMIQNANYNYQLHIREREKSEKRVGDITHILIISLVIILVLITIILAMRVKHSKQQIQLRKYIDVIENLKSSNLDEPLDCDKEGLKNRFLEDLEKLENEEKSSVSEKILESDEYRLLRQLIAEKNLIGL